MWGKEAEVDGYQQVVDAYNRSSETASVTVESWPDRDAFDDALRSGEASPDVYLASRRDLSFLRDGGYSMPVDELLDERSVEFGDGYSRDALEAFSMDTRLQCMPFGVSPMVIYRNTELVDLERMEELGLDTPVPEPVHLRRVPGRRRVRHQAAQAQQGRLHRALVARAGAVRLLRRRRHLRRR